MDELVRIDTGHLVNPGGRGALQLSSTIEATFQKLQDDLHQKRIPITLSFLDKGAISEIKSTALRLREKYENILILGIGGSALGTKAILEFIKGPYHQLEAHKPRIFVLDNIDPAPAAQLERLLDFRKTALVYTSKSDQLQKLQPTSFIFTRNIRKPAEMTGILRLSVMIKITGSTALPGSLPVLCSIFHRICRGGILFYHLWVFFRQNWLASTARVF